MLLLSVARGGGRGRGGDNCVACSFAILSGLSLCIDVCIAVSSLVLLFFQPITFSAILYVWFQEEGKREREHVRVKESILPAGHNTDKTKEGK